MSKFKRRTDLLTGPKGDQGPEGPRGKQGFPGTRGAPGADGPKGDPGPRGLPGKDGKPGAKGDKGDKGFPGTRGAPGKDGADGKAGEAGSKGDKGERGEQGRAGLDGEQGFPGTRGAPGMPGADGADGRDGTDGRDGEKGEQGDTGPQGKIGAKGDKGDKGAKGDAGPQGEQGEEGEQGPRGWPGGGGGGGFVSGEGGVTDHGDLTGLDDSDDHPQYVLGDGTREQDAVRLGERADHVNTPAPGKAELWVENTANQSLQLTDDAGTDFDVLRTISNTALGRMAYGSGRQGELYTTHLVFYETQKGLSLKGGNSLHIQEDSSPQTTDAGYGRHWVKDDAPTVPMFRGDDNVDHQLAYVDSAPQSATLTRDGNGAVESVAITGGATWTISRNPNGSVASLTDTVYLVTVDRDVDGIIEGVTSTAV